MIKQLMSEDIKDYLRSDSKKILLDVRTEDEWDTIGRPVSESLGIKTFFITMSQDPGFIESVTKKINKENKILVMCAAGGRSLIAAHLLEKEGYSTHNISDGYSGNGQDLGWKNSGLPSN